MKISKAYKLEKVASKDASRIAIQNILITKDGDKRIAVATDGRVMAIVPVSEVDDATELGLVSPAAIAHGRKIGGRNIESEMTLNGNIAFPDGSALPRPSEQDCGKYPGWDVIRKDALQGEKVFTIAFNPALLLNLAEALGFQQSVTLAFKDEMSPIVVTTGDATGILMPCRS